MKVGLQFATQLQIARTRMRDVILPDNDRKQGDNMQTKGDCSSLAGKTILVTGANGGIGSALIEELLARGARKIYAGAREAAALGSIATGGFSALTPWKAPERRWR